MTAAHDDASADRWLALLAGANTWDDPERRPNITVRSTGGTEVLALMANLAVLLCFWVVGHDGGLSEVAHPFPLVLTATSLLCMIGPALTLAYDRDSIEALQEDLRVLGIDSARRLDLQSWLG